jgi:3-hydroxybutyryl-CoA dehydratase
LIETAETARFEQIDIGQQFFTSETFGFQAMDAFAELSGDRSIIHTDSEAARECGFPDRLQYGFLLASLLSRIVGVNFHRAVCAAVSLDFMKPVPAQARVEVTARVTQVQHVMRSIVLAISMNNEQTTIVRGKLTIVFLATD